jgi:hypothetical protein
MVSLVDGSKATTPRSWRTGGGVVPAPPECWQCQQPDAVGRQKRLAEIAENAEIPQRVGNASA